MSGHSAKSALFFYYRCTNASKRGLEECPGHCFPKNKLQRFIIDKIRNCILNEDNLREPADITREEMDSIISTQKEHLRTLDRQLDDAELRLEHLYDALEKGSFSHEELAPIIWKLQSKKEEFQSARKQVYYSIQSRLIEAPDMNKVLEYVADLLSLLVSSPIVEQKTFLKAFIRDIVVDQR